MPRSFRPENETGIHANRQPDGCEDPGIRLAAYRERPEREVNPADGLNMGN